MSELYGDWAGVLSKLKLLPGVIQAVSEEQVKAIAEKYLRELKDAIDQQTLAMAPLSDDYFNRKLVEGLDERTLIATHEYVDNLNMHITGSGKNIQVFVGALAGTPHKASGLDMATLAKYLEDGTSRMPARPHIQPVWERVQLELIKNVVSQFKQRVKAIWY